MENVVFFIVPDTKIYVPQIFGRVSVRMTSWLGDDDKLR